MQYTQLSRRSAGVKSSDIDWEKQYLTFIPVENAVFNWTQNAVGGHLEYSINGGQTWVTIANGKSTPTITAGSKVMCRGNLEPSSSDGIGTFSASGNYNAYGNIMSLLYYDNYYNSQLDSTKHEYAFYKLFESDTHLLSAPLLTSTTLVHGCYGYMFDGCTSLTTAPALPATTLASGCYSFMFYNCTSLTTAPDLPATTLTDYCYSYMFEGCTSLTTAPELPATTLETSCYRSMFQDCTSLTRAPELPATTLETNCYRNMFAGCTRLNYIKCLATNISASNSLTAWVTSVPFKGAFVKAADMNSWRRGPDGIPPGWTIIDNV